MIKYFSTFSGIGGFELGIQQGGISSECIGYSEVDKYAVKVYENRFKEHINYGDITQIDTNAIADFDLLVGGFPCQAFSIAGKRKGFDDTRGTLFFELVRILRDKQPSFFIFENVKGLLNHGKPKGITFRTIISTIDELGYDCEWQVINSKNFGVPQNRERVFIIGHTRRISGRKILPILGNSYQILKPINTPKHSMYRIYDIEGFSPTLTMMTGGNRQPKVLVDSKLISYGNSQDQKLNPLDGLSQTLSSGHYNQPKILENKRIRRLTPKECERLQGFPDDWTKYDSEGGILSDSQRYKMCGNAVTVNVISEIIKRLFNGL